MWRTPTLPLRATTPLLQRMPCTLSPLTKTPGYNANIIAFWKYFKITVGSTVTVLARCPPARNQFAVAAIRFVDVTLSHSSCLCFKFACHSMRVLLTTIAKTVQLIGNNTAVGRHPFTLDNRGHISILKFQCSKPVLGIFEE